ncbi:MAG: hypothetical protein EOM72_02160 [Opitutae bacterium]|nr:hypothetical protein [Opitutae bacterium]
MELPPFAEAVARICARDRRYAPEAFLFLHDGLMRTLKQIQEKEKKSRQISGAELAEGLRAHALAQFGPLAMTVLGRWGVRTTRDFGEIVFALLGAGLLGKTEEDRIEDFDDRYDFDAAFRAPFRPKPRRPSSPRPRPLAAQKQTGP